VYERIWSVVVATVVKSKHQPKKKREIDEEQMEDIITNSSIDLIRTVKFECKNFI